MIINIFFKILLTICISHAPILNYQVDFLKSKDAPSHQLDLSFSLDPIGDIFLKNLINLIPSLRETHILYMEL